MKSPKMKCCTHDTVTITWHTDTGQELTRRCSQTLGCGEWLTYGPSAEEPVFIEIRAAELRLSWEDPSWISEEEFWGWSVHCGMPHALDSDARPAGWLSREIRNAGTTRDGGTWTWDVTRPIADQTLEIKTQYSADFSLDPGEDAGQNLYCRREARPRR